MTRHLLPLICLLPFTAYAQNQNQHTPGYPQHYFRNPLNIPIFLAGNFGECRPGHFHSGVDIKTNGRENQPVYAAADGYISRIKMEKGGFGHALYITHPNGYTTLYAHLNNFVPAIQKFLRKEQYKQERWNVDLSLSPNQFPVKKGQQIAWSGNTGASTAPHLHFEIRNTKTEHPLNPEQFGLPIKDNEPPLPTQLAIYDLNKSIYEQEPRTLRLKKKGSAYAPILTDTITASDALAGIGVNVNDYMNGSDNTIAFYTAEVYMDDKLQSRIKLDDIGYDETRYVNAYADYKTKQLHKKWIQCFFKLPGNHLDHIYEGLNNDNGGLDISDARTHKIRINITDDRGNNTIIAFYLRSTATQNTPEHCADLFKVNEPNNFSGTNVMFRLDDKVLYDNICFTQSSIADSKDLSDRISLQYPYVPAHRSFELSIKPNVLIPMELSRKVAMLYSDGTDTEGRAATNTNDGWYKAAVRNFGTFWLAADTTAPVIRSLQKENANLSRAKQITFVVKDRMTSVKEFRGELDGKWICFEQHGDLFFYKFDEHCPKGKHQLVFTAIDENDNTQKIKLIFTR